MNLEFLESIAIEYKLSPEQTEAFLLRLDPNRQGESEAKLAGELKIGASAFKKRLTAVYQKLIPFCKKLESAKRGKFEILRAALLDRWKQEQTQAEPAISRLKTRKPFPKVKLPDNFVNRPDVMKAVKAKLLREDERTLVVTAITGLGGIGKSVLASALILDKEVREWFVDGILWVPLGQNPNLLSYVRDCIRELDKSRDTYSANTLKRAAEYLDRLLMGQKMLLVLDDVWNAADADWFRVSEGSCRVLVTTREAQLEGADYYNLDLMTGEEAIELVRQKLRQQWKPEQEAEVRAFAKVLGHLPLALNLAANQVRDGLSWQELRLEFEAERRAVALGTGRRSSALKLLDSSEAWEELHEEEQRKYSLQACFNLSLKRLNQEQFKWFVWLGVLPEDVNLNARMAAVLWNLELVMAQQVLIVLRNRSLLTTGVDKSEGVSSYRIHDLIHDLARNSIDRPPSIKPNRLGGLGLSLPTAHAQFLERYRQLTQDRRWDKLPNDGYIYRHLTWHMIQANWLDEIHSLMTMSDERGRNAWFEACDRIGQPAIFVGDIARAWELAESMFDNNPEVSVELQIHYALVTSTLKSLTKQIPPNWIKLLVEHKYWTFEKAWSHTLEIKDKIQQAYTIFALCRFIPSDLVSDVLIIISSIPDDNKLQCLVFEELSKYVEVDELYHFNKIQSQEVIALNSSAEEITKMLLDVSRKEKEDNDDVELLLEIVSDISTENLELFLKLCRDLDPGTQVELLCELSQNFPHLKSQALEIFSNMSIEDYNYNYAICSLAQIEYSFVDKAASFVLDNTHYSEVPLFLPKIAAYLSNSRLDEFLDLVLISTPDPYYQAEILGSIAPFLNDEMLRRALGIASEISLDGFRFSALDDMAPHIKREQIQESFDLISSLQNDFERIWSLIRLGALNDEIWKIVIRELDDGLNMNQFQWILIYRNLIYFMPKEMLCELDLEVITGTDRDEVTNILLNIDMLNRGMIEVSEIVGDIFRVSDDDDFEAFMLLVLLASNLDKESLLAFAFLFSIDRDNNFQYFFTSEPTGRTLITSEWESLLLQISQKIDVSNAKKYIPEKWNDFRTMVTDISDLLERGDIDTASFIAYKDNFLSNIPEICPDAAGLPYFVRDCLFYSLLEIEITRSPYSNFITDSLILCALDCRSEKTSIEHAFFHTIDLTLAELMKILKTISAVEAKSTIDKDRNLYSGKEMEIFESVEDYTKFKLLLSDISQKGRQELIPFLSIIINLFKKNTKRYFSSIVAELIMKNCEQWH